MSKLNKTVRKSHRKFEPGITMARHHCRVSMDTRYRIILLKITVTPFSQIRPLLSVLEPAPVGTDKAISRVKIPKSQLFMIRFFVQIHKLLRWLRLQRPILPSERAMCGINFFGNRRNSQPTVRKYPQKSDSWLSSTTTLSRRDESFISIFIYLHLLIRRFCKAGWYLNII